MSLIGPEGRKQLKLAARFGAAGIELVASILVGYFGGGFLDRWFETSPYLRYIGLIFGIAAGFRTLFMLAKDAQRKAELPPDDPTKSPPP